MTFVREDELARPLMSTMWHFSDSTHLGWATEAEWGAKIQVGQLISHRGTMLSQALHRAQQSPPEIRPLLHGGFDGSE